MHDQSFNKKTLARVFHKLDFVGIKTPEELNKFIENLVNKAMTSAATGFLKAANPLVSFPLHGRQVFMFPNLWDELVARKLCSNIKRTSKATSRGRTQIVSNLHLLLKEGVPFRIYRLDVKSFYESFKLSYVIAKIGELTDLSPQSKKLLHDLFDCHAALGGTGIPRGLALSAALSEHLMRDFDTKVSGHSEVFFFSRYVDDIIIITSGREDSKIFIRQIENTLPSGLRLNPTKRQIEEANDRINPTKSADATVHLLSLIHI